MGCRIGVSLSPPPLSSCWPPTNSCWVTAMGGTAWGTPTCAWRPHSACSGTSPTRCGTPQLRHPTTPPPQKRALTPQLRHPTTPPPQRTLTPKLRYPKTPPPQNSATPKGSDPSASSSSLCPGAPRAPPCFWGRGAAALPRALRGRTGNCRSRSGNRCGTQSTARPRGLTEPHGRPRGGSGPLPVTPQSHPPPPEVPPG